MKKRSMTVVATIGFTVAACTAVATDTTGDVSLHAATTRPSESSAPPCPTEGEEFETAKLYIEHNATDQDTGVHGLFGGAAWSELCIWAPDGQLLWVASPRGALADLRVADLFFESREPPNDEYSLDDLLADFPEGEYLVGGTDFEGVPRVANATFTHNIPAAPVVTRPALAEDEEEAVDYLIDREAMKVSWDPVVESVTAEVVTITGYEVIVTKVDHEDPDGWSRPVYDVHVGPGVTLLSVPEEFLEANTLYELEVLALEASGNQTISVGFFATR